MAEGELHNEQVPQLIPMHLVLLQHPDEELPPLRGVLEALEDDVDGSVRIQVELAYKENVNFHRQVRRGSTDETPEASEHLSWSGTRLCARHFGQ